MRLSFVWPLTLAGMPALIALGVTFADGSPALASHVDPPAWRLPFDNRDCDINGLNCGYSVWISNAPGIGTHTLKPARDFSQDIDYAPSGGFAYPIRAPREGIVLDRGFDNCLGFWVRINHGGTYSYFIHLRPEIQVSMGQRVTQGQLIGYFGDTGREAGCALGVHLHFGARWNVVLGDPWSGTGRPILGLPGNWWYKCYAPPPNLQTCLANNIFHGVAQYPVGAVEPSWTHAYGSPTRFLANSVSPPKTATAYSSEFVVFPQIPWPFVSLHRGSNPDITGGSSDTCFRTWQWDAVRGWRMVDECSFARVARFSVPEARNQYLVQGFNQAGTASEDAVIEVGRPASGSPHIAAWSGVGPDISHDHATLEYATEGADGYNVWLATDPANAATHEQFFVGPSVMLKVCSTLWWTVQSHDPVLGWSPSFSIWIQAPGLAGPNTDQNLAGLGASVTGDRQMDACDADDDNDGFLDDIEIFVGTNSRDNCTGAPGTGGDAWPPDFNQDRSVNIVDVLALDPVFNSSLGDGTYVARKDLDANGAINIVDVLALKPVFGTSCA